MKRWKLGLAAVLLAAAGGLTGCKQPLYMTLDDHKTVTTLGLPKDLENDPNLNAVTNGEGHLRPPTVDFPDRPPRYITLAEAMAIALESGNRGSQNGIFNQLSQVPNLGGTGTIGRSLFVYSDDPVIFTGGGIANDDQIRAFALDPAVIGSNIEGALAKFDTRWITSMAWNKVDTATANVFNNLQNGDTAQFSTGLFKPLPTGGTAGITYNTNYQKFSNPPTGFAVVNPNYQPSLNFTFEQPLLRDYGIEINQLLPAHPGSIVQNPGLRASGGRAEGILVTRLRFEQQRHEFERNVNVMLFNVENVYWALYSSYYSLYAAEQGLRQSYVTWQLAQSELEAGKRTAYEVAQVRAQFAQFRGQRIAALQAVLNNERQFRGILGLSVEDGQRLVPADQPVLAHYQPDWTSALNEALARRPELALAREEVRVQQFNTMLQQNGTRPDLRFFANYNVNSIGTQLDGSQPANALANLLDNKFNNWTLGLRADMPLGFRDANASVRAAHLNLARSFVVLKNQELKTERFLAGVYQQVVQYYRLIETLRERRQAIAEQLRGLYARIQAGKDPLTAVLQAQTDFAFALQAEFDAIANYNIAIAGFQYAKGTIKEYNNIQIADGPLPNCTLTRAAEHQRQRTAGIVAVQRATPPAGAGPHPLPALLEHQPPTPKLPDDAAAPMMPAPVPVPPAAPAAPEKLPQGVPAQLPPGAMLPPTGQTSGVPVPTPVIEIPKLPPQ
jgi:outer membrane protein TolC